MHVDYGTLDGRRPYYRVGNPDGDPVVVLPGLTDALQRGDPNRLAAELLGRRYYRALTDEYDVWTISRPRHLTVGTSTRDMASGYAAALDDLGLYPATVVGVSLGGFVAQHLAADYPDYVDRLALVSSAYRLGGHGAEVVRRWRSLAGEGRWAEFAADSIRETATGGGRVPALVMRLLGGVASYRPAVPADVVVSCTASLDHDTEDRLGDVDAPTLVVGGTADKLFPEPRYRATKDGIPDATLALFDGVGHDLFVSQSEALFEMVDAFASDREVAAALR